MAYHLHNIRLKEKRMPPAVAIGIGMLATAGASWYAASRGADAVDSAASAAERAAALGAQGTIEAANIQARTQREIEAKREETQNAILAMQKDAFDKQTEEAKRQTIRADLRSRVGQATQDTFQRSVGALTTFVQVTNVAEEQRALEQFGLQDDPRFKEATPVTPSTWDLGHTDPLTHEERPSDYRLIGQVEQEINGEVDGVLNQSAPVGTTTVRSTGR